MLKYLFISLTLFIGSNDFTYPCMTYQFNTSFSNQEIIMENDDCNPYYAFGKRYIDLETLEETNIAIPSGTDFKSCSKFRGLFQEIGLMETKEKSDFQVLIEQTPSSFAFSDENLEHFEGFLIRDEVSNNGNTKHKIVMKNGHVYSLDIKDSKGTYTLLKNENLLYIANYNFVATGADLLCFNLETAQIEWYADVIQPDITHYRYINKVTLTMYGDKVIMEGNESYIDYVQFFDAKTGERLAEYSEMKNN